MDTHARPLDAEDARALAPIDRDYARAHGLEPRASEASLRFFARTGHAFVAEDGGRVLGFVLAQPLFDGERATVVASRLATAAEATPSAEGAGSSDATGALRALLKALTKSAYDAGIYDIRLDLPAGDAAAVAALTAEDYRSAPTAVFTRHLGSRGAAVAAARRGEARPQAEREDG